MPEALLLNVEPCTSQFWHRRRDELNQNVASPHWTGMKLTSLSSSRRISYRHRGLKEIKKMFRVTLTRSKTGTLWVEFKSPCATYFSVRSRGVRRSLRIRSLCLGWRHLPVWNLTDTFFNDEMSRSNPANSVVSLYFLNSSVLLVKTNKK